ncbi:hypothetical protein AYI70_g6252 [Smittium culicis]|uniref:Uncharacterized protein n=1 Tax=Smittium culicis TaxID=133412 RepID=A0A1R1X9U8_9FUNG|nr:hypothetical protein AYI70_g9759 [Smittium culicis]OMJ17000.1 hypothetical protein AYI70_g6252 [Smittium culicis]
MYPLPSFFLSASIKSLFHTDTTKLYNTHHILASLSVHFKIFILNMLASSFSSPRSHPPPRPTSNYHIVIPGDYIIRPPTV